MTTFRPLHRCLATPAKKHSHNSCSKAATASPLPAGPDPDGTDASEIRRLAEEVGRMGVRAVLPSPDDLISDGGRAWLDGETVDSDEPPVIDVPASAPAPAFTPARRPAAAAPTPRPEPAANVITTDNGPRQTRWELVTPPGER